MSRDDIQPAANAGAISAGSYFRRQRREPSEHTAVTLLGVIFSPLPAFLVMYFVTDDLQ